VCQIDFGLPQILFFLAFGSNLGSLVLSDLVRANLPRRDDNFDKP